MELNHTHIVNELAKNALEVNASIDDYVIDKLKHMGIHGADYDKCIKELERLMETN